MSLESQLTGLSLTTEQQPNRLEVEKKKKLGMVPLAAKRPPNTNGGQKVAVDTNLRRLFVAPNQPIYKYDVQVNYVYLKKDGSEMSIEMSKSIKRGAEHHIDKQRCLSVYKLAIKQFSQLRKGGPFFYDNQSSLYSLRQLEDFEKMSFSSQEVSKRSNFVRAEFALKKVSESFQTSSNDVGRTVSACPAKADHTLLEALSLITSGPALENENVITVGNCVHYLIDHSNTGIPVVSFDTGMRYSAVGTQKGIKALQGDAKLENNKPALFMVSELKNTLFHPDGAPVIDVLRSFESFRPNLPANSPAGLTMLKALRNVEVFCTHGDAQGDEMDARIVRIRGFGDSARNQKFLKDGEEMSVADYFKKQYGIDLKYPDLFTIEGKLRNGGKSYIPVELLKYCCNQKVTNEQMIGTEQRDMIKSSAAPPHIRKNNTNAVVREVGLASQTINGFIKVMNPERVTGIVLPKPDIFFANNAKVNWAGNQKVPTDFKPAGNYVIAAKLLNWEVVFMKNEAMNDVIPLLVNALKDAGMTVNNPKVSFIINQDLKPIFRNAKANNVQLLFFITRSRYNIHQEMKVLEQEFDMLTQEICYETAEKVFRSPDTKRNIVNKMNMKLGGLNYLVAHPELSNPERLFIGFETSQRGGAGDGPVSVGFSANMMKNHHQFAGGYVYVPRSSDVYGAILKSTIKMILETCKNARCVPRQIFIYFSGVTEGQYALINEFYSEQVKLACLEFPGYRPAITIIASSKIHNERLYLLNNNRVGNLEPGTIVDHTIVSPVCTEWYHAAAVARQGTTKVTKYTLIFTTITDITSKSLEEITNALCFDHQIICAPVSLPAPLYIAGRYSQRGAAVIAYTGLIYTTDGAVDYDAINGQFNYSSKKLRFTRFNA